MKNIRLEIKKEKRKTQKMYQKYNEELRKRNTRIFLKKEKKQIEKDEDNKVDK